MIFVITFKIQKPDQSLTKARPKPDHKSFKQPLTFQYIFYMFGYYIYMKEFE